MCTVVGVTVIDGGGLVGGGVGLDFGVEVGGDVGVAVELGVGEVREEVGDEPGLGLVPGEPPEDGDGRTSPASATTRSIASLWQVLFQQILTTCCPSSTSSGTAMSMATCPCESAWNGKVWTTLWSWTSPAWLAGTWVAVTRTVSPRAARVGLTVSVVAWATTAHTPSSSSRIRTAATPMATLRRLSFGRARDAGPTRGAEAAGGEG